MDHSEYREALDAYKQERLPVVLTAAEAMDLLGVGKNTMYRLLKSGELPAVRIGHSWRLTLEAVEYFLCVAKYLNAPHNARKYQIESRSPNMFRFPPNSDCIGVDYCNTDIKYSCQRSLFYPKENYKQDLYYLLSICKSQHTMFQRLNPVCGDPLNLEKMKAEIPQDAPFHYF